MATTLRDIAVRVGLSEVSVSQALRGTGRLSSATRSRIMEVARELRYRPHAMARSMREGRTGIVGLIYGGPSDRGQLSMSHLAGIQRKLADSSYELMLGEVAPNTLAQMRPSGLLRQLMADGLLINQQIELPTTVAELISEDQVPAVWMNKKLSRNCVYIDDAGASENATEYLLQLGHTRIAYLDHSHRGKDYARPEHYSILDRADGYARTMRNAGLEPRMIVSPDGVPHDRRVQFCVDVLSASDRPTAILCYAETLNVLAAAMTLGIRVPRDLSVVGFASSLYPVLDIPVATLLVSWEQLGHIAASELIELINNPSQAREACSVPIPFHPQSSTAPPGR